MTAIAPTLPTPAPAAAGDFPATISRDAARLFLVRRHFLAPPRSLAARAESVLEVVDRLGSLQFDPLDIAGRNHDLVLLARISGYRREWTDALLYEERRLFEAYNKSLNLLPTIELPWYRLTWDRYRVSHERDVFPKHRDLVDEILDRIRAEGPLSAIDFGPRGLIDWYWRPTNAGRAMLEALAQAGILGLARRQGNRRYYDLIERLFPADLLAQTEDPRSQRRHRLLSRFRAHGLLGRVGSAELWLGAAPAKRTGPYDGPLRHELIEELLAAGDIVPVRIEGEKGERFVVATDVALLASTAENLNGVTRSPDDWHPLDPEASGVAFLAPLDPFVWDREFTRRVFDFDYRWEVYVPEAKREWGYYVLPVLWGDRLVGRIEPRLERAANELRIIGTWWERGFEPLDHPEFIAGLAEALGAHRAFGDASRITVDTPRPRMSSPRAVREAIRRLPATGGRRRRRGPSPNRGTILLHPSIT